MKIYEIKNTDYETKKAIGENMEDALRRYHKYLEEHIGADFSYEEIYRNITKCQCIGDYGDDEIIQ